MDIRWKQRFNNLERAHYNLIEMLSFLDNEPSNKAYKLAVIQSYEMDMELAWKTLKDYLNYLGYIVQSPREAVKQAFSTEILKNGDMWLKMLEDRNLTSHIYDEAMAQEVVDSIKNDYFSELGFLYGFFKGKLDE